MAPRVLGLSFSEVNKFVILFLTGAMVLRSKPALNAAFPHSSCHRAFWARRWASPLSRRWPPRPPAPLATRCAPSWPICYGWCSS
jgi:hypothetical protein